MGMDVYMYAEGKITEEEIAIANARFAERGMQDHYDGEHVQRSDHRPYRVHRQTLMRYYNAGYERGDWPTIYAELVLMAACFPNATIHYGHDCDDDAPAITQERVDELWIHWAGPDGDAYHEENRRQNAAARALRGQRSIV